jgi:hypothetical protein
MWKSKTAKDKPKLPVQREPARCIYSQNLGKQRGDAKNKLH